MAVREGVVTTVVDERVMIEDDRLCYGASRETIEGVSVFRTADIDPVVTIARCPVNASNRSLKRNGFFAPGGGAARVPDRRLGPIV